MHIQCCGNWCPGAMHQGISSHSVDQILIVLSSFIPKYFFHSEQHAKTKLHFGKNNPVVYGLMYLFTPMLPCHKAVWLPQRQWSKPEKQGPQQPALNHNKTYWCKSILFRMPHTFVSLWIKQAVFKSKPKTSKPLLKGNQWFIQQANLVACFASLSLRDFD